MMNISEKLSFGLSCGFDWSDQLEIYRHMQAYHRIVSESIQKSNTNLKEYKKLRRFCIKIPLIKINDYMDIEEKAQPYYTYPNRLEEWIFNFLASFHYILKHTEENLELRFFMAAPYEHVDDLFIYRKFLKPIEVDNFKMKPSKFEEKKYELSLRIKNIMKPDDDIKTKIRDFEKLKDKSFHYSIIICWMA
jgi:hypothetical protein